MVYSTAAPYLTPMAKEFAEALNYLTPPQISDLIVANGIPVAEEVMRAGRPDANARLMIATHLAAPEHVQGVLMLHSRMEIALLYAIWRRGPTLRLEQIANLLKRVINEALVEFCLARLQQHALLLPTSSKQLELTVPACVRTLLLGRFGAAKPIVEMLSPRPADVIQRIATTLGVHARFTTKADRITNIEAMLNDAEKTRERIARLPELARLVLEFVRDRGGTCDANTLAATFPGLKPVAQNPRGTYSYLPSPIFGVDANPDGLPTLERQALLLREPPDWGVQLVVPDEVLTAMLPPHHIDPAAFALPKLDPPPAGARGSAAATSPILDLVECLQFVEEFSPSLTQKGLFAKPDAKRLARRLSLNLPTYADFIFSLTWQVGLLKRENQRLSVRPRKASTWLNQTELAQRDALMEAWVELPGWVDDQEESYLRNSDWLFPRQHLRSVLQSLLLALPEEGCSLASLVELLRFERPRMVAGGSPLAYDAEGYLPDAAVFITGALRSLAWLGMCEPLLAAGGPAAAPPEALRVTDAGRGLIAYVEDGVKEDRIPRTEKLIVQPTLDILTPPNIAPATYREVRRFTDPAGAAGMRTLTLTPASLRRALDRGMKPAAIRGFLEKHLDGALPNTVSSLLDEVGAKFGRVHIGQATFYLTVDDPHLLAEIGADKRLTDLHPRTLSPTVALIGGESLPRILERLRAAGHMPISDTAAPAYQAAAESAPDEDDDDGPPPLIIDREPLPEISTDQDWEHTHQPIAPTERIHGKEAIVGLLDRAIDLCAIVEMEHRVRTKGFETPTRGKLELYEVNTGYVFAYDHLRKAEVEIEVRRISWARLTGESIHALAH